MKSLSGRATHVGSGVLVAMCTLAAVPPIHAQSLEYTPHGSCHLVYQLASGVAIGSTPIFPLASSKGPWGDSLATSVMARQLGMSGSALEDVLHSASLASESRLKSWMFSSVPKTQAGIRPAVFCSLSSSRFVAGKRANKMTERVSAVYRKRKSRMRMHVVEWQPGGAAASANAPENARDPSSTSRPTADAPAQSSALERRRAMEREVREKMRLHNVAIQKLLEERMAEIKRRRAACKAGDRQACRIDPGKSGATRQ